MSTVTRNLRTLLRELRLTLDPDLKLRQARITQYILQQHRRHQVTEGQHCKAAQEMSLLANSYATYLQSQRQWKEVHQEYHKGELTTQQAASRVGFKLPHDPK